MAELSVEIAKEFTRTTRKRIPVSVNGAVAQIKAILDYPTGSRPDIAFALLCDEDGNFHLLANRDVTEINWDIDRSRRDFPPNTWVNPDKGPDGRPEQGQLLVVTYPGGEYVGFCGFIGGVWRWF